MSPRRLLRGAVLAAGCWLAWLSLAATLGACATCDRDSWCEGDVLKLCFVGASMEPTDGTLPCEAPLGACVELDSTSAMCVYAPAEPCGDDFVDRCDGSLRVYCRPGIGFAEAVDCATLDGATGCGLAPESGLAACL